MRIGCVWYFRQGEVYSRSQCVSSTGFPDLLDGARRGSSIGSYLSADGSSPPKDQIFTIRILNRQLSFYDSKVGL